MIKQLKTRCINFLVENIDVANVFTIVQYCLDVEVDKKVMENCKDFLQCEIGEMVKTDEFNHISIKCLKFLLELNHINLPEIDLFKAVSYLIFSREILGHLVKIVAFCLKIAEFK